MFMPNKKSLFPKGFLQQTLVELPGNAPGSAKQLVYASTSLASLKILDCLPINKQKAYNHSLLNTYNR